MSTRKNHEISLETAVEMTRRFRSEKPAHYANSETFSREAVAKIMNEGRIESLRIYYGMKEDKTVHAILVGVDKDGNDILPTGGSGISALADEEEPVIIQDAWRCPPLCPKGSPLNEGK